MEVVTYTFYSIVSERSGIRLMDADWSDRCGWLVVQRSRRRLECVVNGAVLHPHVPVRFPIIRWVDSERFLLADARSDGISHNVFLVDLHGNVQHSFCGGDGIEDIAVGKEGIWISYFDEGVFGKGISAEGLVLFRLDGSPIFNYHSHLTDRPMIIDCYAICKGRSSTLWLFPYNDFSLIHLDPCAKAMQRYEVPEPLHGSTALCVRGKYAYFGNSYHAKEELYSWDIGNGKLEKIGRIHGAARGLGPKETSHFISVDGDSTSVHTILNPKEYEYSASHFAPS
ncbi:TetR family transcriptional regulator [Geobacillus subterraneus]|uniref:TetR family transcriptional regulator n=1 Tax=Geobacillus subterraneus TaxID=129338 RepID=UPI002AC96416|nr:TetR family transcriptional regulator [Geobacillus subterraneus]WPZ19671.1 TetR family transcriptional regulator [Geobacillus subterraneus]